MQTSRMTYYYVKRDKLLQTNNTWNLIRLLYDKVPIGCNSVYKIKYKYDGYKVKSYLVVMATLKLKV